MTLSLTDTVGWKERNMTQCTKRIRTEANKGNEGFAGKTPGRELGGNLLLVMFQDPKEVMIAQTSLRFLR
jgi:hypothetical protein